MRASRRREWALLGAPLALALLLLSPAEAEARDCPSLLAGHLFELGEELELGFEVRAFYVGLDVGDGLPLSAAFEGRRYTNHVMTGLRTLLYWYPRDGVTLGLEDEIRWRWPGWFDSAAAGLDHRPVQLFVELDRGGVSLTLGLQPLSFGSGAALDQRFFAAAFRLRREAFRLEAFGGLTARHFMRNAANSMWMSFMSDTNGWKFVSQRLDENSILGVSFSLSLIRPYRLQALYLFAHPSYEHLRGHLLALHFSGPILRSSLSFLLELLVQVDLQGRALPAAVLELRARLGAGQRAPQLLVGGASSFNHRPEQPLNLVYENLSWGILRRFNLAQGHLLRGRLSWAFVDHARAFADYVVAFPGGEAADELDLGVELRVNDLYRLSLAYVGLNLAGASAPSHAVYVEARVIIGR